MPFVALSIDGWFRVRKEEYLLFSINQIDNMNYGCSGATSTVSKDLRIDVHQHIWTGPLIDALSERDELPFIREEQGLTVLFGIGERPYVIDLDGEAPARRSAQVKRDGLDGAMICLSSPVGIEALPRAQALELIDAYHHGALELGHPFGVWGAIPLDGADPADVDRALDLGCAGISLPAGALGGFDRLARLDRVLGALADRGAPLLIDPGPGAPITAGQPSLRDPLWWAALTRDVADMQSAWLAFSCAGRRHHPELRVVFTMLAGLAPLHAERLQSRGGPAGITDDPLTFYDTSSYGPSGDRRAGAPRRRRPARVRVRQTRGRAAAQGR